MIASNSEGAARLSTRHIPELDSLRGLAAYTVLIRHYLNVFAVTSGPYEAVGRRIEVLKMTPAYVFVAAHESVMLFFVLSGFVLSLPFQDEGQVRYLPFAVKRACRIYVPYIISVGVALLAARFLYSGQIAALSDWFNHPWSSPVTLRAIVGHVVFVGSFETNRFNPVLWTLVHEMRISLVFPLLMAAVRRANVSALIGIALGLSVIGVIGSFVLRRCLGIHTDYLMTAHYASIFVAGAATARWLPRIRLWYSALRTSERAGFVAVSVTFYLYGEWARPYCREFCDLIVAAGGCGLVVTAVCAPVARKLCSGRVVRHLGKVSYSLYLYHALVLLAVIHLFFGKAPIGILLLCAAGLSSVVAAVAFRWIEIPGIRLGKYLASHVIYLGDGGRKAGSLPSA